MNKYKVTFKRSNNCLDVDYIHAKNKDGAQDRFYDTQEFESIEIKNIVLVVKND